MHTHTFLNTFRHMNNMVTLARRLEIPGSAFKVQQHGKFTIIGEGYIGGKTREPIEKQAAIERAGMLVPETVTLATDFFNSLYRSALRENITTHELQKALIVANFSSDETAILEAVFNYFDWVAVRSSQLDETGGNGRYFSGFASYLFDKEAAVKMVKRVVASSAQQDMAVMIQPLIMDENLNFPLAAGCAYSTRLRNSGDGKIVIVNGFGTKAVQRGGDVYFFSNELRQTEIDPSPLEIDRLQHGRFGTSECGDDVDETVLQKARERVLEQLPKILKTLERELGKAQYIEFALGQDGIYCLQIADTEPIDDKNIEFDKANVLASGTIVNGCMQRKFSEIIYVRYGIPSARELEDINSRFKGHLLVVESRALTSGIPGRIRREMFSNAAGAVIISSLPTDEMAGEHARGAFGPEIPFMVTTTRDFFERLEGERIGFHFTHVKLDVTLEVNEAIGKGQLVLAK